MMEQKFEKSNTSMARVSLRSERYGQSIGAIVSDLSWKTNESLLGQIELIPTFESEKLVTIRQSLSETNSLNYSAYDQLSPIQKQWIHVHLTGEKYYASFKYPQDKRHYTANPLKFKKSAYKTIALEMREDNDSCRGKIIALNSMDQLICVLNYAHVQRGRRIILINQTTFSSEELLIKIKAQLPESERKQTLYRLELLLCKTEDSIFSYDQFNGLIGNAPFKGLIEDTCSISSTYSKNAKSHGIFAVPDYMPNFAPNKLPSCPNKPT